MSEKFWSLKMTPLGILSAGAALVCAGTIGGFLGRLWWRLELLTHFQLQYFLVLVAAAVILLLVKKKKTAAVFGLFSIANLAMITPLYLGGPSEKGPPCLRALMINVNRSNHEHDKVLEFVKSADPDLMIILEVNNRWMNELAGLAKEYPHHRTRVREDCYGMAFFSRVPMISAEFMKSTEFGLPYIFSELELGGEHFIVFGIHTLPPRSREYAFNRNQQMEEVSRIIASQKRPVLLLGDLNTTSWSPYFRDFIRATGLRDGRRGFGLQNTWPSFLPWFGIAIDHCLHSDGIGITNHEVGPNIGSDHFPVIVDFYVEPIKTRVESEQ
jgi:endonuclease/exonuclease/phosphatase (EEP) superfamily protein YafD